MKKVREGMFETNSSSTHSIFARINRPELPSHIDFKFGSFEGYSMYEYKDECEFMASYLYTTILLQDRREAIYYLLQLQKLLNENNITYTFENYENAYSSCGEKSGGSPYIGDYSTSKEVLESLDNIESLRYFLMECDVDMEYDG